MPVKNPRFFTIIGETNEVWENYQIKQNKKLDRLVSQYAEVQEEIASRQYQDRWRNLLADYKIVVSKAQAYRQAGNSIVVDVLIAIMKEINKTMGW